MKKAFIATTFFAAFFLLFFAFSNQTVFAVDPECDPPYEALRDGGGSIIVTPDCIFCFGKGYGCVFSETYSGIICYVGGTLKMGNFCTTGAMEPGKCEESGECIVSLVPPAITMLDVDPLSTVVGSPVTIAVQGSDDKGVIALYIDLGDGAGLKAFSCSGDPICSWSGSHSYASAGTYTIKAQSRDTDLQDSAFVSIPVVISGALSTTAPHIDSISPTSGLIGQEVTITGSNFNLSPSSNYAFFNQSGLVTSYAGIRGDATYFVTRVPASTIGTAIVSVKSWIGGSLVDSDNSVSFLITGGALPPPTCLSRFGACTTNSQCCSNECSSFSRFCYDSSLSGGGSFICYDNSECSSGSCIGLAPGTPGSCSSPTTLLPPPSSGGTTIKNPLRSGMDTLPDLLNAVINFIFWIGITIAPIILIIAGFLYVTSAGDPKKLETAKNMIIYAVIGLAVLLLAKGLVLVLKSIIGVS